MDPDHKTAWETLVARLRGTSTLRVVQFEIGAPVTKANLNIVTMMDASLPADPILNFYSACDGIKLLWDGTLEGEPVQGSVNIVPLLESALRAPLQETGEPLEGILWDDEFDPSIRDELKRMAIFESLAGRSAHLTYIVDAADARLFLVEDDRIAPIVPNFATTITLIERYAGAEGLRKHLTHSDWEARIASDDVLRRILAI